MSELSNRYWLNMFTESILSSVIHIECIQGKYVTESNAFPLMHESQ